MVVSAILISIAIINMSTWQGKVPTWIWEVNVPVREIPITCNSIISVVSGFFFTMS